MEDELKLKIQEQINILGLLCSIQESPADFSVEDLVQTLIIFQYVAQSLSWNNKANDDLTFQEQMDKAVKFGIAVREAVEEYINFDINEELEKPHPIQLDVEIITK